MVSAPSLISQPRRSNLCAPMRSPKSRPFHKPRGGRSMLGLVHCDIHCSSVQGSGVRNEIANAPLAAFPSESLREGLRDLKGDWENPHNAWACFLHGQNKKQKKRFKKVNDPRNGISTINKRWPSSNCRLEVKQILIHNKQAI